MAPSLASLLVTGTEPACLHIIDCPSSFNWREQFTSYTLVDARCQAWVVTCFIAFFKNANICLVDDFTSRLIDNGLVKFLIDDNSNGSFAFLCRTQLAALHWEPQDVMCPVNARKKLQSTQCPYIAAFDVYSIGVVKFEQILGSFNGGQSSGNGIQFNSRMLFRRYVKNLRGRLIVEDG
jgi:hypothetical protein